MKVDITRWMYRSGRPNRVAAVLNRWWAIVWSAGLGPNRLAALEVRGRRYLRVAPGDRPHIPVDQRAPLADFERIAAQYPVFRIRAGSVQANRSASPTRAQ